MEVPYTWKVGQEGPKFLISISEILKRIRIVAALEGNGSTLHLEGGAKRPKIKKKIITKAAITKYPRTEISTNHKNKTKSDQIKANLE